MRLLDSGWKQGNRGTLHFHMCGLDTADLKSKQLRTTALQYKVQARVAVPFAVKLLPRF